MDIDERIKEVGTRIKLLRIKRKMKQKDVAKAIGVSQAHLSNIESGHNVLTLHLLLKLHDVLGCSCREFFEDVNDSHESIEDNFNTQDLIGALNLLINAKKK